MTKNKTKIIQKSILKTLAYYRAVRTPLTLAQIGRYLITGDIQQSTFKLSEVKDNLDILENKGVVSRQNGLYWLFGSGNNHELCVSKYGCLIKYIQLEKVAQQKINKVRKALKVFSFTPFLRAIFICGSVARKVCRPESDIDFLIVSNKNRVWTVRLFLTLFTLLLGRKTHDPDPRINKFCLNHYRSTSQLILEPELQDLYSAHEYARMINIYSANRVDKKFFKKNKKWMKSFLTNFNFTKLPLYTRYTLQFTHYTFLENMLAGKIGNIIEKLLYYLQTRKIAYGRSVARYAPTGDRRVVTGRGVIMFHLNPRSPKVLEKYQQLNYHYE